VGFAPEDAARGRVSVLGMAPAPAPPPLAPPAPAPAPAPPAPSTRADAARVAWTADNSDALGMAGYKCVSFSQPASSSARFRKKASPEPWKNSLSFNLGEHRRQVSSDHTMRRCAWRRTCSCGEHVGQGSARPEARGWGVPQLLWPVDSHPPHPGTQSAQRTNTQVATSTATKLSAARWLGACNVRQVLLDAER